MDISQHEFEIPIEQKEKISDEGDCVVHIYKIFINDEEVYSVTNFDAYEYENASGKFRNSLSIFQWHDQKYIFSLYVNDTSIIKHLSINWSFQKP